MRDRPKRGVTVLDAMILVAVTALGLGLTRLLSPEEYVRPGYDPRGLRMGMPSWTTKERAVWAVETFRGWYDYLLPLLITWTIAVFALRVCPPRPRFARLLRQPGFIACISALSGITLWMPALVIQVIRQSPGDQRPHPTMLAYSAASAVGSAWLILLVTGRWRAEPDWIDRFGCLLGATWLVPIPLAILTLLLA